MARIHRAEIPISNDWSEILLPQGSEIFWVRNESGRMITFWTVPSGPADELQSWTVRLGTLPDPPGPPGLPPTGVTEIPDATPFYGSGVLLWVRQPPAPPSAEPPPAEPDDSTAAVSQTERS
ncbi:hypothetical protein [Nocardia sp. NPDC048505]|uniref:hypothetical protein n=1 Tax=unclassified Nocardia TaxID=2637762 RepID=UPI00340CA4EC